MLREAGGRTAFIACYVSRRDEVEALIDGALKVPGRPDLAVNNAGIEGKTVPMADQTEANLDAIPAVNLKGVFFCLQSSSEKATCSATS